MRRSCKTRCAEVMFTSGLKGMRNEKQACKKGDVQIEIDKRHLSRAHILHLYSNSRCGLARLGNKTERSRERRRPPLHAWLYDTTAVQDVGGVGGSLHSILHSLIYELLESSRKYSVRREKWVGRECEEERGGGVVGALCLPAKALDWSHCGRLCSSVWQGCCADLRHRFRCFRGSRFSKR